MSAHTIGLAIFLVALATDLLLLVFDEWLDVSGRPTLSQRVWAGNHRLGRALMGVQVVGAMGLAVHLFD